MPLTAFIVTVHHTVTCVEKVVPAVCKVMPEYLKLETESSFFITVDTILFCDHSPPPEFHYFCLPNIYG